MGFIALLVFIIVQILFIPLVIIGVIIVGYKQMYVSKKFGVSSTAIEIINGRWTMDIFGIRKDSVTKKLIGVLPNTSLLGLWMVLFPSYLRYKISGKNKGYPSLANPGEEGVSNIVLNRTVYIDTIIQKSKGKVEQFVVMGAGFDTRCYENDTNSNLKYFELDKAKTQKFKIDHLQKARVDISNVSFVDVDFSTEQWYEN